MRQFLFILVPGSTNKRRNLISPLMLLTALFLLMLAVSCSKTGPAGADGPPGAPGPAGPKGDPGSGSSTVIYSDWLDVAFKPDTVHKVGGKIDTIGYYADINVPKLTLAMLNTAEIKAYINSKDASDPMIYPLPYHGSSGLNIEMSAYTQNISLYSNGDVSTVTVQGKKIQQFRYMIVPGNTRANGAAVNWADYSSAKAYLRLKD